MITGTVWGITIIVLGILLSLGAMQLLAYTVFPRLIERAATLAARRGRGLVYNLLRGVAAAGLVILLFAAFANGGPGLKVLTFLPFFAGVGVLVCGLAGVSLAVGGRLPSPDDQGRRWKRLVRGAITMELAYAVPIVGWFFLTGITAVIGLGAVTGALLREKQDDSATESESDEEHQSDPLSLEGVSV